MNTLKNVLKIISFKFSGLFVEFGHNSKLLNVRNYFLRLAGLTIEAGAGIDRGFDFMVAGHKIKIGGFSIIGIRNHFWNYDEITIGRYCMFAADVILTNGDHDKNTFEPKSGSLVIGNGCWVGNGVQVSGSLNIGANSILAAGSLVIKDVPPCAIVAGVPAKIIGYRELPDKVWHLGDTYFCPFTFETVKNS